MPFESSLPRPTIPWRVDGWFPHLGKTATITTPTTINGTLQDRLFYDRAPAGDVAGVAYREYPIASSLFVGTAQLVTDFRGVNLPHRLNDGSGFDSWLEWKWPTVPILNDPALLGALETPEWQRCVWLQFGLTGDGFVGGQDSGILFGSNQGAAAGSAIMPYTAAGATFRFFGLTGDGAGGIQYASFDTGGALLEAVAAPGWAPAEWNTVDFIIIGAGPGRDATFEMKLNGTSVAHRTFGSAVLPYPPAGQWRQTLYTSTRGPAGFLYVSGYRLRMGGFDPDGLEIPS